MLGFQPYGLESMVLKSRRLIRVYSSEEPLLLRLHRKSSRCRASAETIWYNAFVSLPKCNLLSASARQQISQDNTGLQPKIYIFFLFFLSYPATIQKALDVFEASCQINWFFWIMCLVMCVCVLMSGFVWESLKSCVHSKSRLLCYLSSFIVMNCYSLVITAAPEEALMLARSHTAQPTHGLWITGNGGINEAHYRAYCVIESELLCVHLLSKSPTESPVFSLCALVTQTSSWIVLSRSKWFTELSKERYSTLSWSW